MYTIPQLPNSLQGVTLQPDPATNPAGLFFRTGSLDIYDDTTIRGTVISATNTGSRVYVWGKRVRFEAASLPALQGTTLPVQMPAVVTGDSFRLCPNAEATLTGAVVSNYDFEVAADNQADMSLSMLGRVIARNVTIHGRSDWVRWEQWWNDQNNAFHAQEGKANGIKYFPEWLQAAQGLNIQPRLTIKPETTPVRYHWHNPQDTIYIADPADGGLLWDLLVWKENV